MDPEYENSRFSKFTTITTSLTECTRTVRRARPDRMRSPALAFGGWPVWLLPPRWTAGSALQFPCLAPPRRPRRLPIDTGPAGQYDLEDPYAMARRC